MSKKLILNGHQAKAVADAMCALNNVGALCKAKFPLGGDGNILTVTETEDGEIAIRHLQGWGMIGVGEVYASQGEFFSAYSELMDAAK